MSKYPSQLSEIAEWLDGIGEDESAAVLRLASIHIRSAESHIEDLNQEILVLNAHLQAAEDSLKRARVEQNAPTG